MAELFKMPKLGMDMEEGIVVRWLKAEGEKVEKGEALAEIETDKSSVEVESPASGTVFQLQTTRKAPGIRRFSGFPFPGGGPMTGIAKGQAVDMCKLLELC